MTQPNPFAPPKAPQQAPPDFPGSYPEYLTFVTLQKLGYDPQTDFSFQSSQMGGRANLGGLIVDFLLNRPPGLAINVNGVYYHYERKGTGQKAKDVYHRQQLGGLGYTLIFVDDSDLLEDPTYYISEALEFRDHSELRQ